MGKIFLIPSNDYFDDTLKRTEFTVEMLERLAEDNKSMYKNVLSSFLNLDERFTLVILYLVDTEVKKNGFVYQCRCDLLFDNVEFTSFFHDTTYKIQPFLEFIDRFGIQDNFTFSWDENQWHDFWIDRIREIAITELFYTDKVTSRREALATAILAVVGRV